MSKYGILIDYDWCTGCHSCEFACQMEHQFPIGQTGILVNEIGPWQIKGDKWQYSFLPAFTDQCDLCAERVALGKLPSCVSHCQSQCMYYGTLEELQERLESKTKQALFALK